VINLIFDQQEMSSFLPISPLDFLTQHTYLKATRVLDQILMRIMLMQQRWSSLCEGFKKMYYFFLTSTQQATLLFDQIPIRKNVLFFSYSRAVVLFAFFLFT
jgi:hypothetical protein